MIHGKYKIYLDGELVAEESNIITNFGKNLILKYLASNVSSYAGAIAVGVSAQNPSPSDYVLDYELFRIPIAYKTVNPTNSSVIFKGTAGTKYIGKIYEIGLFPSLDNAASGAFQTSTLFAFDSDENWQNVVLRDVTNARVGSSGIQMNASASSSVSVTNSLTALNLVGYSPTDVFKLAFVTFDTNCAYVTVKFTTANGAEITGNFIPATHTAGAGNPQYQIVSLSKSYFSNQNADWSNIVASQVTLYAGAGGASQVTIDGLKVIDADNLNPEYGLVSRALLSSPVTKTSVQTIDVEYSLEVPL